MDTLEALGDHRLDAQQVSALGCPVAAGAGTVFLAGDHHQRCARGLVLHGGIVDRHFLARRDIQRVTAFFAAEHFIADTDIGEGAAHHHFMVAPA